MFWVRTRTTLQFIRILMLRRYVHSHHHLLTHTLQISQSSSKDKTADIFIQTKTFWCHVHACQNLLPHSLVITRKAFSFKLKHYVAVLLLPRRGGACVYLCLFGGGATGLCPSKSWSFTFCDYCIAGFMFSIVIQTFSDFLDKIIQGSLGAQWIYSCPFCTLETFPWCLCCTLWQHSPHSFGCSSVCLEMPSDQCVRLQKFHF